METQAQELEQIDSIVIRFAGDSGDGMQVTGNQFTQSTALSGHDLATFPDYPAEIRAPAGTTFGVSGFQIHFASRDIMTPGDAPEVLVAMNPAALKVNLGTLVKGGLVIINTGGFTAANLKKAGYETSPLEDGTLDPYRKLEIDISKLTVEAVKEHGLKTKAAVRCKNFWTLGLLYWMFDRDRQTTVNWLKQKFKKRPELAEANISALNAGHAYGETTELPSGVQRYKVLKAEVAPGTYRNITGNEAVAWGLVAGARMADLKMLYGSYPITPASNVLHYLAKLKNFGVTTYQAEDEIAAVCAAIGGSFGGGLGVTGTSGPGVALKGEAIGLAISVELPLVIVDVQRAGPSTGLPTKTEQSDLFQAVYGRNGDAPLAVVAASTPGECFRMAVEATRIAVEYMTPVILLTDGYLGNGAEPWKIPNVDDLPRFKAKFHTDPEGFHPFLRGGEGRKELARVWAVPGTKGLEHRIGGLEKGYDSGNISYDPANHQKMTDVRAEKIRSIADDLDPIATDLGEDTGDLVVVGWGSTYGAIHQAVKSCREDGLSVSHVHLRHIWPMRHGIEKLLRGFKQIMVPEMNAGMLNKVLRAEFLVDAKGYNQVTGQPFRVADVEAEIRRRIAGEGAN